MDRLWAPLCQARSQGASHAPHRWTAPVLSRDLAQLETLNLSGEAYAEQFNATAAAIELALASAEDRCRGPAAPR